jgi:hypothetical protein
MSPAAQEFVERFYLSDFGESYKKITMGAGKLKGTV